MQSASPFDQLAAGYDAEFTHSVIGKMQRGRVWNYLTLILNKAGQSLDILEINCGTGHDAIQLAALGHRVRATDASASMIERAMEKMNDQDHGTKELRFSVCRFDQLHSQFNGQQFDIIFSNFGGLNCIDEAGLSALSNDLHQMMKPGGSLILVLMGKCCIREMAHYAIRGKFKQAFRRLGKPVDFTKGDSTIKVYYYSPGKIKSLFSQGFRSVQNFPVGFFIPPSYLEKKYEGKADRLDRLNQLEKKYDYSFLSSFSDHYGIILKKAEQGA